MQPHMWKKKPYVFLYRLSTKSPSSFVYKTFPLIFDWTVNFKKSIKCLKGIKLCWNPMEQSLFRMSAVQSPGSQRTIQSWIPRNSGMTKISIGKGFFSINRNHTCIWTMVNKLPPHLKQYPWIRKSPIHRSLAFLFYIRNYRFILHKYLFFKKL